MAQDPKLPFAFHDSVAAFAVPKHEYLAARPGLSFGYIATATLVLDKSNRSNPRVLLLQRAASDDWPNKWEPPGGAVDDDDQSILHAAARELLEEAGIVAKKIGEQVGEPYYFDIDIGRVCQFSFVVDVGPGTGTSSEEIEVILDPQEHQRFVWATEDEVKDGRVGDIELDFTSEHVLKWLADLFQHARETESWEADFGDRSY